MFLKPYGATTHGLKRSSDEIFFFSACPLPTAYIRFLTIIEVPCKYFQIAISFFGGLLDPLSSPAFLDFGFARMSSMSVPLHSNLFNKLGELGRGGYGVVEKVRPRQCQ